jgi:hypothetical protein
MATLADVRLDPQNKWRNVVRLTFRLSPALLALIEADCAARKITVSDYRRYLFQDERQRLERPMIALWDVTPTAIFGFEKKMTSNLIAPDEVKDVQNINKSKGVKHMNCEIPAIKKKSLGGLWPAKAKSKPRSPDLTGQITLQRHTLAEITKQLDDDEEVVCNLAAWANQNAHGEKCLSVELSPRYVAHKAEPPKAQAIDFIWDPEGSK